MGARILGRTLLCGTCALFLTPGPAAAGDGELVTWNISQAGKYLDERGKTWFEYSGADRGEKTKKTTCVSCHTLVPYALGRPALRQRTASTQPTVYEQKLLDQTRKRVEHWSKIDTDKFGLLYDFNEQKKKEAWGTEAILNALILAFDDRYEGRPELSDSTKQALANLWKVQVTAGDKKGSWEWLDFGLEPWESPKARFIGAALAAIAVGTAPKYYTPGKDAELDKRVELLRGYLRGQWPAQNLHNRLWMLWAAARLDGFLTKEEQTEFIKAILDKQQKDGGWSLSSLGTYTRLDGTKQVADSDGYATGLILHVLQTAGLDKKESKVAKGLAWLQTHQAATGEWRASSLNKQRNPATLAGKFMSDAATAYAIMALNH